MELTRRSFLEMSALAASARLAPAAARRPNIILMLGDDHRADALGCAGNPIVHTPELDRLAHEGVRFANHFCTTPICCTSRASIMLGQYASTHGINDFSTDLTPAQLEQAYFTAMRAAGYYTGFIGKFGVGDHLPSKSFDVWHGFPGQGFYFPQGEPGPHLTHIMRDQAQDFLRNAPADKPFLLSMSFKAPHEQDEDPRQYLPSPDTLSLYKNDTVPPPPGAPMSDVARFPLPFQRSENRRRWAIRFSTPELYQESMKGYYRLISGTDAAIGAIRKTLEERGLADNTILIYSADHGVYNGEHGFSGKWYPHEESLRIPLLVMDPRLPASLRGRTLRTSTLNIDLHPTLLELAGLSRPAATHGRSFVPHLHGEQADSRAVFFVEHRFPDHGFIPSSEAIRTDRWKYIRYTDNAAPFEELYDLHADRHEMHNLIASPAHMHHRDTLRAFCTRWKDSFAAHPWHEPISEAELAQLS